MRHVFIVVYALFSCMFRTPIREGGPHSALVDLRGGGGPSLCLNSGPGSEPGVNGGLGSL